MKLFIGCSSSDEIDKKYMDDCINYLHHLLKNNDLVFGAYDKGLMKVCYDLAKKYNNKIIGIAPKTYQDDLKRLNCDKSIVTDSIINRTKELINECDAIIFLPGGIGTINEMFSSIDSARSLEINKPIIIYNSCNYYDKLFDFLDKLYLEKFSSDEIKKYYHVSNSIEDTLSFLNKA